MMSLYSANYTINKTVLSFSRLLSLSKPQRSSLVYDRQKLIDIFALFRWFYTFDFENFITRLCTLENKYCISMEDTTCLLKKKALLRKKS